jgi:hypothetical protein
MAKQPRPGTPEGKGVKKPIPFEAPKTPRTEAKKPPKK